ncbi:MAG: META domain-containing protein [Flavobacterium sp.]|uniref:META domain-containing protein n=1 Tax=Flavobacterium sp. TaxID=239 RepID=UPI00122712BE|nr:META domain-containing protein [Flavobacterium sp.]RZJ67552.1 MAG: META domain-containing protein [Flavobacterium sp.]
MRKLLFFLPILFVVSCKCKQKVPTINGSWTLEYLSAPGADFTKLYPNEKPTLNVDVVQNQASGKNGCNNFSGGVKVVGNLVTFDQNMITTKMFCPGDGERIFMGALFKANAYTFDSEGKLTLLNDDIAIMRFAKK